LEITDRTAEGLARLVMDMREVNEKPLVIFQINHSGNVSNKSFSEAVSYYATGDPEVRLLFDEEVEEIKGRFVKAALIAHQVGADGIDFKMCHGYLGSQLLRPANTREGGYGGSFENRTRFFRETAEEIKKAIKDRFFILGTRLSFYEGIVGGFGTSGPDEVSEDHTEPLAFVRMVEDVGFHFVNVSGGIPVLSPDITRPTKPCPGGVYRQFGWAQKVKNETRLPVIGSAYSYLRNGEHNLAGSDTSRKSLLYWAEKNIRDGRVDMVGIGRQSLADPLFARKVLSGEMHTIKYCTICGGCSELLGSQALVGCSVHDPFYAEELRSVRKAKRRQQ
jgi:2,4-dienoyl-CoA reductase-like NADH-dependent reductase (Old Yellow Enzyme family)